MGWRQTPPLESQRIGPRETTLSPAPLIGAVLCGPSGAPGWFLHLNHLLPSSGSTLPTPLDNPSDNGRPCSALVVVFGAGRSVGLGAGVFRKRGFSAPGVVGAHGTGQQKPAISVRGERWLVYPVRVAPYPTHSELVSSCFGSGGFGVFSVRVCPGRLGCQHSLGGYSSVAAAPFRGLKRHLLRGG